MTLWCEMCGTHTTEADLLNRCLDCGTALIHPPQPPCYLCQTEERMPGADICFACKADQSQCWNYSDLLEMYPDLCAECFERVAQDRTGMCVPCYKEVIWGGVPDAVDYLGEYYPSHGWAAPAPVVIPSAAEELETIPAMRVPA